MDSEHSPTPYPRAFMCASISESALTYIKVVDGRLHAYYRPGIARQSYRPLGALPHRNGARAPPEWYRRRDE